MKPRVKIPASVPEWAEKPVSISTVYARDRPPVSRALHDQVHIPLKNGGTLTLYRDDNLSDPDSFYAMIRDFDGRTIRGVEIISGHGALQGYLYGYDMGQKNDPSKV